MGKVRYCPFCHKEIFTDRLSAERAADAFANRKHSNVVVYLCDVCGGYHLTHYSHCESRHFVEALQHEGKSPKRFLYGGKEYMTFCKRNGIKNKRMRQIPYRGKQGREHGEWEFLQHVELPDNILQLAEQDKEAEIAAKIDMELVGLDHPKNDIRSIIGEEAYFEMWDRIDKRGFFRNGEPTVEALRHASKLFIPMREAWEGKPHKSKEDMEYEAAYQENLRNAEKDAKSDEQVAKYDDLEGYRKIAADLREANEKKRVADTERFEKARKLAKEIAKEQKLDMLQEAQLGHIFERLFDGRVKIPANLIKEAVQYVTNDNERESAS